LLADAEPGRKAGDREAMTYDEVFAGMNSVEAYSEDAAGELDETLSRVAPTEEEIERWFSGTSSPSVSRLEERATVTVMRKARSPANELMLSYDVLSMLRLQAERAEPPGRNGPAAR
jgi:hypothetical protein